MDSVNSLRLKGLLDNGTLYREVAQAYDLCFTKDAGFAQTIRQGRLSTRVKLLRVGLPQTPAKAFAEAFVAAFQTTDWSRYSSGAERP